MQASLLDRLNNGKFRPFHAPLSTWRAVGESGGTPINEIVQTTDTDDLILRALVALAATATLVGVSASRHVELSNRLRLLTAEFRRSQDPPTAKRKESIQGQVAVFKRRCEVSAVGHMILYFAVGVEVLYFTRILSETSPEGALLTERTADGSETVSSYSGR